MMEKEDRFTTIPDGRAPHELVVEIMNDTFERVEGLDEIGAEFVRACITACGWTEDEFVETFERREREIELELTQQAWLDLYGHLVEVS